MVNPFSGLVLGSGAVLSSPALWAFLVEGTMPFGTAAVRFGVAVAVAWIGLSLFGSLVSGTAGQAGDPSDVPLALAGTGGHGSVQGAVVDAHDDPQPPSSSATVS